MTNKQIPRNLRNILINLDFFGNTPEGKKPCISDMSYVDQSSFFGSIKRWRLGESKDSLISAIEELTAESLDALTQYESNNDYFVIILTSLLTFNLGIQKIRKTYTGYPRHCSSLKICSTSILIQLEKYKDKIPENLIFLKDQIET